MHAAHPATVRDDFDAIARLSDRHGSGSDRYDAFLAAQVPARAARVLDIGCGLGRLAARVVAPGREVIGVDLSPEMVARARSLGAGTPGLRFECADFFDLDPGPERFDCVLSAAVLHHLDADAAIARMIRLLAPGGRLVLHDLRTDASVLDRARAACALAHHALGRLVRTGRLRSPKVVRQAWARHGAGEVYLTFREAQALASRLLPGSIVYYHWLWRYTIVCDRPAVIAPVTPGVRPGFPRPP
jgi:SAM-dependent methyltransferase